LVLAALVTIALVTTYPLWVHPTHASIRSQRHAVDDVIISWDSQRMLHGCAGVDAPFFYPHTTRWRFPRTCWHRLFVAPVFWITENPLLTYNVAFVLSFALAGLGMYLLAGALVGNRTAALVAAVLFAFCPLRMSQVSHIQTVATGWIPITLYALHQYHSTRRVRWLSLVAGYCLRSSVGGAHAGSRWPS
jgi:hypothetical protein